MKKKVFALAGATVLTVSLLAGATYAWFTSTVDTEVSSTITGGTVRIVATGERTDEEEYLFPQLTDPVTGAPDIRGTIDDVAKFEFKLTNESDRQVLVQVAKTDIMTVLNKENDGTDYTNDANIRTYLTFSDPNAKHAEFNGKYYIFLPYDTTVSDLTLQVWIDSAAGNDYQRCTVRFKDGNLGNAKAVQYREAAIQDEFGLAGWQTAQLISDYNMPDFE